MERRERLTHGYKWRLLTTLYFITSLLFKCYCLALKLREEIRPFYKECYFKGQKLSLFVFHHFSPLKTPPLLKTDSWQEPISIQVKRNVKWKISSCVNFIKGCFRFFSVWRYPFAMQQTHTHMHTHISYSSSFFFS